MPQRSGAHNESRKDTRVDREGLWDWNLQTDRIHFSPRWITLVGCEDHEIGGTPEDWFQRVHPEDSAQLAREIQSARSGESTTLVCRHRLRYRDGTYRWMLCRGTVMRNKAGEAIRLTGSHSDVTVEMVTDSLTGLPNRLLLMDRLMHSIERSRRYKGFHFAVLVIDLGRPVNPVGRAGKAPFDPIVTAVARRLETCLRIPDTMPSLRHNDLVARMDDERFAILLDGLKEISHAKIVGERILREILKPFTLGGREVNLSAGGGIAVSATGYTTAEDVVHDAETALHRAHVLGGSRCEIFDTGVLKSEQVELQLEGDFDAALHQGEFELFYQPIVSLASNELLGFEALVRWRHPVLGLIAPTDFLPVAERTGFIVRLGNWVLREACLRLGAWQTGLPSSKELSISVNLSGLQLNDAALVDEITEALHDSGLEPRRLTLELTEGVAMANPSAVTTLLMRIRAMGVRISVDDFGTGYSSLAYLRQFPLDALKIDRSFVRGMVTNKDTAEIVASLIGMSQQLGLHVVAEGIEHEDQLAQLRTLQCDAGQGDLFAKPLDVGRATELLKSGLWPQPERSRITTANGERDQWIPQLWMRGRSFMADNRVSLAVVLALVCGAGLVVVTSGLRPALGSSRMPGVETKHELSVDPPVPQLPVSVPEPIGAWKQPPTAVKDETPMPLATVPESPAATSVDVVHLHRLGSCRGRLAATRDSVAFVVKDGDTDEAFTLKHTEFLHALTDDTLTLKSATKTYRFKAAATGSKNSVQLRDLADLIARARR
jgi:diguanylate cyclase (GGDEF)-like protein/PAS domain S-box-containing protein